MARKPGQLPGWPPGMPSPYQQPAGYPPPGVQPVYPDQRHLPPVPPSKAIRAWWPGDQRTLTYANSSEQGVVRTATISSPLFDLRPDLQRSNARPMTAVPIYRPAGGGYLYVQIDRIQDSAIQLNDLEIRLVEFGHIWDANRANRITSSQDVTSYLTARQESAVLAIQPQGAGYNMRFWQARLRFNVLAARADPTLTVWMCFY
jgi:hypothetical protein